MDELNVTQTNNTQTTDKIGMPKPEQRTVHDWVRDMRMSADVNNTTVGVDTDRVTPDLLLATSRKLLGISRREQEQDSKDSMQFQRVYGPVEYFSEHVLRDSGKLARNLLWKATNRGNLDFMQTGALDKHMSDVFYDSKLANMVDGSSPLELMDGSMKITRIGEGGVGDMDSAPVEMRLVQPSFYGYVDPVRSVDGARIGLDAYLAKNLLKGSDGKLYRRMINAHTGKEELVDSVTAAKSVVTTPDMMKSDTSSIYALGGKTGVRIVDKKDVDYYMPRSDEMFSTSANLVPMLNGVKEMRLHMGCLHPMTTLLTIDASGLVRITRAKATGNNCLIEGTRDCSTEELLKVRNTVSKFPPRRNWFKRVVMLSGRTLVTSADHRWSVLRDGKWTLATAAKLKAGDVVPRSLHTKLPTRKTYMCGTFIDADMAYLLGQAVRTLRAIDDGKLRIEFPKEACPRIEAAIARMKLQDECSVYSTAGLWCLAIAPGRLFDWLSQHVGLTPDTRQVPPEMLSAGAVQAAAFMDGYSSDPELVALDPDQNTWLLHIACDVVRDGLSVVLSRIGVDTLYRDARKDGEVNLALQLVEMEKDCGDFAVDVVKNVADEQSAPTMVDVDVDDNLFATASGIVTHNSKYALQSIPLDHPEPQLVRTIDEATGKDMPSLIGKYLGAQYAKKAGHVAAVRKDRIDVVYDDGTKGQVPLYVNFPMNAKGFITNRPSVKAGQSFGKGDLLAASNWTDDKGVAAIGKPLRAAWISWKGGTYEDGITISESCAEKLRSTTMYPTAVDLDKTVKLGKENYQLWKPGAFSKAQLETLDKDGVVKPGTVLHAGDPMILAVQTTEPSPGTLGKRLLTDVSETWSHDHAGVVTDVVKTRKGVKVMATVSAPCEVGDKLSGCFDDQTDVFTDRGFVRFADLTDADKVAVLHKDGTATFENPIARQVDHYAGCMVKYSTRRVDFCVTPNHFIAHVPRYSFENGDTELVKTQAHELYNKRIYMRVNACFDGVLARPTADTIDIPAYPGYKRKEFESSAKLKHTFKREDFAKFLGIYLAEGHCSKKSTSRWIRISQYDNTEEGRQRCKQIAELLDHMGLDWKYYDHQYFFILCSPLWAYVSELGDSYWKYVPEEVFSGWSKQDMCLLLDWFYMGDGEKTCKGDSNRCATVSEQLANDLQRLYILTGRYSNVRHTKAANARSGIVYKVASANKEFMALTNGDESGWSIDDSYDGNIYCVTTSTGVILTRRNGITSWNGQSYGNKGTISQILPDDQMPQDKDGNAIDLLLSPLGLITRCYDEQTEFLTRDGWKFGKDVLDTDELMCYDKDSWTSYYTEQLQPFYRKQYTGKLYCYTGNTVEFAVTEGHKIFADNGQGWKEYHVEDLYGSGCALPDYSKHNARRTVVLCKEGWSMQDYSGMTYCPTVKTGYVVTRRNGHIACLGNTNASQLHETLLGKIAHKTGKPEYMPEFYDGDLYDYVNQRLKQHHLTPEDDLVNPETGKPIKGVLNGYSYIYKLKHLAESKMAGRGTAEYTSEGLPSGGGYEGSKRYGSLEQSAMVSHMAFNAIQDAKQIRGQSNSDFWRSIRTGGIPTMPGEPMVQRKFFAHLQGAGVNVRKTKQGVSVFALTNADVDELAGPRELKSKDTYEAKNFRPMDGGLFGQDVFGINGDKWGYIQLDEPVPNPVMEDPLARLLRMTQGDFEAVVSGEKTVDGMSSSSDIAKRLQGMDLEAEAAKAKKEFKDSTKSRRDAALKRYKAIELMRRQGVRPEEYMLTKIPVLPPDYRPVSTHSGLTMVADSNYLYAQLLDARNDLRDSKDLPDEYQQKARANLYRKWKELAGLYDPENPKLQSKNVKGLLAWALGNGSPKFSGFQRKVLGSTVDTVGRGVVVANSRVKLNEVGMPEKMAFDVYAPFVERELVKAGYTPVDAMKLTKAHDQKARSILLKVMQTHPVQMNRAPTLHKLSIMGFNPVLVPGHAIHVNPSIVSPFAMDFDGDTIHGEWLVSFEASELAKNLEKFNISEKSCLTSAKEMLSYVQDANGSRPYNSTEGDTKMFSSNDKARFSNAVCSPAELPVIEDSKQVRGNVTEWDVVPGIYTDTIDLQGNRIMAPVTKVSKHEKLKMFDVTMSAMGMYQHVVTASEDHSLITFNPDTFEFDKTRPEDAVGKLVPRVRKDGTVAAGYCQRTMYLDKPYELDHDFGIILGMMLGDGWVTEAGQCIIAACDESVQNEILRLTDKDTTALPVLSETKVASYAADPARFSQNNSQRIDLHVKYAFGKALRERMGHDAWNKRIPADCLRGSHAHLTGLLVGLLATDGTVSYADNTTAKKSASKTVQVHTTSPELRDGIQELCSRIGIRTSVTAYMGKNSIHTCYAVSLSIVDLAREYRHYPTMLHIPHDAKAAALARIVAAVDDANKAHRCPDIVPLPLCLGAEFSWAKVCNSTCMTRFREQGYIAKPKALEMAAAMKKLDWGAYKEFKSLPAAMKTGHTPEQAKELVDRWIAIVEDESVSWEHIDSVTPSSCTEGWDCTVPGPYTFTLASGTVVQDTVNLHVPVSDQAREDTYRRMFPERNLIAMRDRKIAYKPEKEYMQGTYMATRIKPGERTRIFDSLEDARKAYRDGQLDVDDPIIIRD